MGGRLRYLDYRRRWALFIVWVHDLIALWIWFNLNFREIFPPPLPEHFEPVEDRVVPACLDTDNGLVVDPWYVLDVDGEGFLEDDLI